MNWKVIVFDWDGTLVDSERHIVSCIEESASVCGLPRLSYDRMKSIIGLGMREALVDLYPDISEEQVATLRAHYSKRFHQNEGAELQLFPGVEGVLSTLKQRGYRLAVATGKSRRGLDLAKQQTRLGPYFEIERCADETRSKPDPLMLHQIADHFDVHANQMLMIGDTTYDLEMATRAGAGSIAVSYGVHAVADLKAHQPHYVVDDLNELLAYLPAHTNV